MNEPAVTDTAYMGPWLATTIRQCDGLVDMMSYWTLSDVFEEQGVVKKPLYGGYGLIAAEGIPKPAFNAFKLLHELGDRRIALDSDSALLTRRKDGSLVLAIWNYAAPGQEGAARSMTVRFKGSSPKQAKIFRSDPSHGDMHTAYEKMGSPVYPTRRQLDQLKKAAGISTPEVRDLKNGELTVTLPAHGLAVLQLTESGNPAREP